MSSEEMPAEVRRFILTSVPSVPYLEALLLLRGESAAWDAKRVASRLFLSEAQAGGLLQAIVDAGFAERSAESPSEVRYRPSPELAAILDLVARAYSADLVGVTNLIHSRIDKRAQYFADAFRWRKEP